MQVTQDPEESTLSQPGSVLIRACAILRDPWVPGHITEDPIQAPGARATPVRGLLAWPQCPALTPLTGSAHIVFGSYHVRVQARALRGRPPGATPASPLTAL